MPLPVEQRMETEMVSEKQAIMEWQSGREVDGATALVIAAEDGDRLFITAALGGSQRRLHFANNGFEVRALLAAESIPVVIVDGDAQALCWRELLAQISEDDACPKPKFIVISCLADERLWAEVLNLGAYDLLPKPLDADEVAWVVRSALSERNGTHGPA